MREAGVSFVTLGVFSWSWLEPAKGEYDFAWLDDIMGLLHDNDIAVDLATATATPPPWLSAAHPEILPVDHDGRTLWPGSRQALVPELPGLPRLRPRPDHPARAALPRPPGAGDVARLERVRLPQHARATATPAPRGSGSGCAALRGPRPPQRRVGHGLLEPALHRLGAGPAAAADHRPSPTRRTSLDYKRFQSDTLLDFHRSEKAILNDLSPGVPVTTNFMTLAHFEHLDYHQWAADQDVVSTDHYVVSSLEHPGAELAFSGDLTRGLAGGAPWLLMEHSTSAVNWQPVNPAKAPGQTIRDSIAHVARGADTIGFFQWRQSRVGLGEVPLRARPARRPRQCALPRGVRPRGTRPPARGGRGLARRGRGGDPLGLPGPVGSARAGDALERPPLPHDRPRHPPPPA